MLSSNTSAVSGDTVYVEDVFSSYLYNGASNTALQIQNGIDLSTKGGMVWIKCRSNAVNHALFDTSRGVASSIQSNSTNAAAATPKLGTFNTDGFTHSATPTNANLDINETSRTFASWTFRKQPKFFDVVTYTGNGVAGRQIAHNLGSTPGCIIVKATNNTNAWTIWHRSVNSGSAYFEFSTAAADTSTAAVANRFGNGTSYVAPTSAYFTVGANGGTNGSSITYVAYIFAHDAGGFGLTGTDNVISCGSYTGTGATQEITLGYEPQWIMVKKTNAVGNWVMGDVMRGIPVASADGASFYANTSDAEQITAFMNPTATGFNIRSANADVNTSGSTYIYIAIRRGPMKVPTDATKVFSPVTVSPSGAAYSVNAGFPTDLATIFPRIGGYASISYKWFADRLRGTDLTLSSVSTAAELSISGSVPGCYIKSDNMTGLSVNDTNSSWGGGAGQSLISYNFRRAPSFFDEVCFTGTGSAVTVNHNLQAVPELMIVKSRSVAEQWLIYHSALGNTKFLYFTTGTPTTSNLGWNNTSPTSTQLTVGAGWSGSGVTLVAYLFATCPGVSKVGNYTGTGTTLQVDCGFAAGARFVLIKRTDSTGDWYVWDTARGIVSGNDPYLLLNSTAAEVTSTDYIDTYSAGFELSSTAPAALNASGGTYIFLAIA